MKANRLMLRVYGERSDGQWSLICLEFSLAAQAESLEEAQASLEAQIREYLADALAGQDKQYADVLLNRRAPLKYWIKWKLGVIKQTLVGHFIKGERATRQPIPLVPA